MTSSEDSQKDMEIQKNRIITYATNHLMESLVEFLKNPGWTGTWQTLDKIEDEIKNAAIDKCNAHRCDRSFNINGWRQHMIAKFS